MQPTSDALWTRKVEIAEDISSFDWHPQQGLSATSMLASTLKLTENSQIASDVASDHDSMLTMGFDKSGGRVLTVSSEDTMWDIKLSFSSALSFSPQGALLFASDSTSVSLATKIICLLVLLLVSDCSESFDPTLY